MEWCHIAGARIDRERGTSGSGGPSDDVCDHGLFLEYFGLRNLEELPSAEELRRIPVVKPEALQTVEGDAGGAPSEGEANANGEAPPVVEEVGTATQSSAVSPEPGESPRTESATPEGEAPR